MTQQAPNSQIALKKPIWIDVAAAVTCVAGGILAFSLLMDSDYWYWGVLCGIGVFILIRSLYGCHELRNTADANPGVNPNPIHVKVVDDEDPTAC